MNKNNLDELMNALETIRAEQFPDVPKDLLDAILMTEYDNLDNRSVAQTKSLNILDEYLRKNNSLRVD